MKKQFQPLWLLSALAFVLSVGLALNAQQTNSQQGQSTDQQAQQPAPPAAQTPGPPTSDQPAPPPPSQQSEPAPRNGTAAPGPPSSMSGQTGQPAPPPPSQQSEPAPRNGTDAGSAGQPAQPNGVQAFSGTIVKEGDRYMLRDEATGQTYDLDHQDEVQKYAGRRVRVHGTLDPTGKMIHLQ